MPNYTITMTPTEFVEYYIQHPKKLDNNTMKRILCKAYKMPDMYKDIIHKLSTSFMTVFEHINIDENLDSLLSFILHGNYTSECVINLLNKIKSAYLPYSVIQKTLTELYDRKIQLPENLKPLFYAQHKIPKIYNYVFNVSEFEYHDQVLMADGYTRLDLQSNYSLQDNPSINSDLLNKINKLNCEAIYNAFAKGLPPTVKHTKLKQVRGTLKLFNPAHINKNGNCITNVNPLYCYHIPITIPRIVYDEVLNVTPLILVGDRKRDFFNTTMDIVTDSAEIDTAYDTIMYIIHNFITDLVIECKNYIETRIQVCPKLELLKGKKVTVKYDYNYLKFKIKIGDKVFDSYEPTMADDSILISTIYQ